MNNSLEPFIELTCGWIEPDLAVGDTIHIDFHRVQAMWRVKNEKSKKFGLTAIEMNYLDPKTNVAARHYVKEKPSEIYDLGKD